jgi:hypothetical protein
LSEQEATVAESFVCKICGKTHAGLPTDQGYKLPDEVWAIPEQERRERARFTADLCEYAGRHFIRCILLVPFTETDGDFGWGVWVEVERPVFERYISLYEADGSAEPRHPGRLANALPGYAATLGTTVLVQFGDRKQRPSVHLLSGDQSRLALEQRHGIDESRYHEILAAVETRSVRLD